MDVPRPLEIISGAIRGATTENTAEDAGFIADIAQQLLAPLVRRGLPTFLFSIDQPNSNSPTSTNHPWPW
jgi:hypothetical protein